MTIEIRNPELEKQLTAAAAQTGRAADDLAQDAIAGYLAEPARLDWSQCPVVESIPGKVSGAWLFRGTRVPVAAVFENLKTSPLEEVLENFHVTRDQVQTVLDFAAKSTQPLESLRIG